MPSPHALPNKWHLMGVMLSAAGSLRWHRDTLAPGVEFDDLLAPAADLPIGSEGLLFLPYLTGERTPHPDPFARGAYVGLTVRHGLPHMTRAVLEGVAFGLRDSFTLMQGVGLSAIRQVRVSGGGARSPLWRQILADVLGSELVTVNTPKARPTARRCWPVSARASGPMAKAPARRPSASPAPPRPTPTPLPPTKTYINSTRTSTRRSEQRSMACAKARSEE